MRKNLLTLFTLLSFIMPSMALANDGEKNTKKSVNITKAERKMAEAITAEQLSDYLYFIASDAMGGRDTPSPGLDITAQFIALNLKKWGFKPAGDDGSFFQKMTVRKNSVDASKMSLKIGDKNYEYGKDFYRATGKGMADGPIVFGKDGWMVKSKGLDAFKGVDVKNKIVVLYSEAFNRRLFPPRPKGVTDEDVKGEKGVDWADPVTNLKMNGAKGVIILAPPQLNSFWGRLKGFLGGGGMSIEGLRGVPRGGGNKADSMPVILVKNSVGKSIFSGEFGTNASTTAFEIKKSGNMQVSSGMKKIPTQNVVAIWEGSDPKLKQEMVAVGAHYDHVGTRPNARGDDKIWNGADDDGSGTTAVLAIAEALAKAKIRPKRSVLFVWHAGEEKGLLGAAYFNKYPTVDIKKVVVQLNIDMIGRSKTPETKIVKCDSPGKRCNSELTGPNEVYVIGSEMMSSKLGEITKGTNSSYLNMNYNYKYDDPKDKNRFFFRSDHFMYAQNGIPIVFWFTGTHMDYHQASDHADKIDYAKMEKITRTIFLTMWELTELKERPAIDKELPPELKNSN